MSGWFIVHRGWMDSFKPEAFTEREAFLWSVERAAYAAHDQWFNGHRITVARGEFVTSLREMEAAFGWSVKRVRGFMDRMGKAEKWAQRRAYDGAQSPTILTVCNYELYQSITDDRGIVPVTVKGTRGAQSGHSKGTQQKEGNKGNKGKKEERPSVSSPEAGDRAGGAQKDPLAPSLSLVPAGDQVSDAFDAFEQMRRAISPGARFLDFTPERRRKLAARLAEIGPLRWREALDLARASPFLRGETSRSGRPVATIDWLLIPNNLRKVLEGNYDDQPAAAAERTPVRTGAVDALVEARALLGFGGS